jgi:hypothetical protein
MDDIFFKIFILEMEKLNIITLNTKMTWKFAWQWIQIRRDNMHQVTRTGRFFFLSHESQLGSLVGKDRHQFH